MSYKNEQLGYPQGILSTRSLIKKNNFALISQEGLVKNTLPGFEGFEMSILSSPKLGASFVDYICTLQVGARNTIGFGGTGVETFAYVLHGKIQVSDGQTSHLLETGGYIFVPDIHQLYIENKFESESEIFLYKRRYNKIDGYQAYTVVNQIENLIAIDYEDMDDVKLYNLLPNTLDFDMNFHILSFEAGASHGYIETHVQEHGAYILSGEGMYHLDGNWMPVQKGDYIFMSAYCPQAGYGIGRTTPFSYLYSKDCNRDEYI